MKKRATSPNNHHTQPALITSAEIEGCLNSLILGYRAMSAALPILQMDDQTLETHVADDEGFAHVMQLVKILLIDRGYARDLVAMRKRILDRLANATALRTKDEVNGMLKLPINFRLLPDAQAIPAELINGLRP